MAKRCERILEYLAGCPNGADDDEISDALKILPRQSVNQACRQLENEGTIRRAKSTGPKIKNYLISEPKLQSETRVTPRPSERLWYSEAKAQEVVMSWLRLDGWEITSFADTASKQRGADIIAEHPNGCQMFVTVKGYPNRTPKTHPSVQAGHWFKDGFHDILVWRGEHPEAALSFALPDFPRYRALAEKVRWLKPVVGFTFLWVREDSSVIED